MDFMEYGIDRIRREIPEMILNLAFSPTRWGYQTERLTVDARIRSEVLENVVVKDCNIVGGEVVEIPLNQCHWEYLSEGVRITIPNTVRYGRDIISVLSVETVNRTLEPYGSQFSPGSTGIVEVYLVAPNVIFTPINPVNYNCHLRCTLANDPRLNNFNPKALEDLGALAVLACKGVIYNKLSININIDAFTGGNVDGRYREVVDSYSDAWEMYREMLKMKIKKIAIMQDRHMHNRLIKLGL
jgi:hypothetical protein